MARSSAVEGVGGEGRDDEVPLAVGHSDRFDDDLDDVAARFDQEVARALVSKPCPPDLST